MKKNALILMVGLLIAGLCSFSAYAENDLGNSVIDHLNSDWLGEKPEWSPDISASLDFVTKYIWRGANFVDTAVMQSDLAISKWGFTFDLWTNFSLSNDKAAYGSYREYTEVDYTLDYSFGLEDAADFFGVDLPDYLDPISVSTGWIYYTFPNLDWGDKDSFDTHEFYVSLGYDCFLQPSVTWYWDFDNGKGSYFLTSIGHTFEFGDTGITADLGGSIGLVANKMLTMGATRSGFADMNLSASVSIPVFNYFTITPSVSYSIILDEDTYDKTASNEFYGGISIGFAY